MHRTVPYAPAYRGKAQQTSLAAGVDQTSLTVQSEGDVVPCSAVVVADGRPSWAALREVQQRWQAAAGVRNSLKY